ncbi:unnamed protein product [Euphydryas editha]|uniref:Beta-galactoside alpha-2,6-sialyltransferase 2 n=1 Tax=Euphydryas editha TaxID=104508 RepID=A0AAU9UQT7_EUPED|nr:unnamed protein product [Euphydryas editha]
MKAAAMSVWIFINLLCFGMCGYLYLIWSQYWMSLERQRLFNKAHATPQNNGKSGISYQETFSENIIYNSVINASLLNVDSIRKRSGAVFKSGQVISWPNKSYGAQARPPNNIVVRKHGSPRFPNIHKAILEFDSDKYVCNDLTTLECESKTAEFKELLLKEFHRVLMSDSKVFTSGLESQNPYDVKYVRGYVKQLTRGELLCALGKVALRTVEAEDSPFDSLGFNIPKNPLQKHRTFNTCALVSSSGALLGSRLGEFIGKYTILPQIT